MIPSPLEDRFRRLADRWLAATLVLSSTDAIVEDPTFTELVNLGESAIPLVLREMEKGEAHWHLVLAAITGLDPVAPAHQGYIDRMQADWFDWASKQGYRW